MKTTYNRYKYIGQRIKEARESLSKSQKELAETIGFESATAISLIEAGDRRVSITDLEKIAEALQRDIKFFLGTEEKETDIKYALRANKELGDKDKEALIRFFELAKNRKKHGTGSS